MRFFFVLVAAFVLTSCHVVVHDVHHREVPRVVPPVQVVHAPALLCEHSYCRMPRISASRAGRASIATGRISRRGAGLCVHPPR